MADFWASYPGGSASGGSGGGGGSVTWASEAPAGAINGVNTVYTLSFTPFDAATLEMYINGVFQSPGLDFTLVGAVVTFTSAPATGPVWAVYRKT